jgi:hypothetical protein
MFLRRCSSRSAKLTSSLSRTCWSDDSEMQIPPASAMPSSRAVDIHAVAVNVIAVYDDVTQIDARTEVDPARIRNIDITLHHTALDLDGAADGINHARKLDEEAVAVVFPGGCDRVSVRAKTFSANGRRLRARARSLVNQHDRVRTIAPVRPFGSSRSTAAAMVYWALSHCRKNHAANLHLI